MERLQEKGYVRRVNDMESGRFWWIYLIIRQVRLMKLLNLASNNSFWRGIDYHHENRIISWNELEKNCYQGKVKGSGSAVDDVMIDMTHPKKSVCNCPFAEGRRVICKHMVVLELGIFPEKEQRMILLDMRGELPYRDGYTSRPFKANSDDVLFGVPIITIYLPCMR